MDALLDDPAFFAPFAPYFHPVLGRPSTPIECYLRLMFLTANGTLSRVEQIKRFAILPVSWEPGGEEITPTMKLKRTPIAGKYADIIESLYTDPGEPVRPGRAGRAGAG